MKQFASLLKAEFIDHKGGMMWLPLAIAGLIVIALVYAAFMGLTNQASIQFDGGGLTIRDIGDLRASIARELPPEKAGSALETANVAATLISSLMLLVSAIFASYFSMATALHNERADRSILFWKSMPVSDTQTVLAKFTANTVMAFAVALAIAFVVYLVALVVMTVLASHYGVPGLLHLWSPRAMASSLTAMVVFCLCYVIWAAPVYAWILLASAAAPRAPLLVAFMPPLVLAVMEGLFLRSSWLLDQIGERVMAVHLGLFDSGRPVRSIAGADDLIAELLRKPLDMLSSLAVIEVPVGLAVAALFLCGAIEIRRRKAL